MRYYISSLTKRLVTRNNGAPSRLLKIFNHTTNELELSLVDPNNTILDFPSGNYYFVGSFSKRNDVTTIFFSADFEIVGQVLKFNYDTNTYSFLDLIKGDNVQIAIEIGYKDEAGEHVILQDIAIASQRYYIDGMPTPKDVSQYYTKLQTEEAIDKATSGLASIEYVDDAISEATSGAVSKDYVDEQDEALSGAIDGLSSSKQDLIDVDHKLDYGLLSSTPTIPTAVSQLTNDAEYATSGYVDASVSGKADESALTAHTSNTEIHTSSAEKDIWNAKQNAIDADNKLDYSLLSGTPSIPTKTSELQNDSDFATSAYVDASVSGKADKSELEDYQLKITNDAKLAYDLLSGTPSIPTKVSELDNDSGYQTASDVQTAISGKADASELEDYQKLITNDAKLDYTLLSGTPAEYNPVDISLEMKTAATAGTFTGSFEGKQIQKWVHTDATSGSISIDVASFSSTATDIAPTTELHVPINGNVTTITIAASLGIIDIPDELEYKGETANDIQYEVFVIRAVKDMNGVWKFYINYAYSYIETIAA